MFIDLKPEHYKHHVYSFSFLIVLLFSIYFSGEFEGAHIIIMLTHMFIGIIYILRPYSLFREYNQSQVEFSINGYHFKILSEALILFLAGLFFSTSFHNPMPFDGGLKVIGQIYYLYVILYMILSIISSIRNTKGSESKAP